MAQIVNLGRRACAAMLLAGLLPMMTGSLGRTTSLEERLLAAHNRERAAVGLEPMSWDPELAAHAGAWGAELARADIFQHAPQQDEDPQGENLWTGTQGAYTPEEMVGAWAEEKKLYRHAPFPAVSRTGQWTDVGHYTQMVWRETDRVGCAVTAGGEFEYLVCRYRTAGNVIGQAAF